MFQNCVIDLGCCPCSLKTNCRHDAGDALEISALRSTTVAKPVDSIPKIKR